MWHTGDDMKITWLIGDGVAHRRWRGSEKMEWLMKMAWLIELACGTLEMT